MHDARLETMLLSGVLAAIRKSANRTSPLTFYNETQWSPLHNELFIHFIAYIVVGSMMCVSNFIILIISCFNPELMNQKYCLLIALAFGDFTYGLGFLSSAVRQNRATNLLRHSEHFKRVTKILFIVNSFQCVSNFIILIIPCFNPELRKQKYCLLIALAFGDFTYGLGFLSSAVRRINIITDLRLFSYETAWFCMTRAHTLLSIFGEAHGSAMLLAISIDRLICVYNPILYMSLGRTYIALTTLLPFAYCAAVLGTGIIISYQTPRVSKFPNLCYPMWSASRSYGFYISAHVFVFSSLSVILYIAVMVALKKRLSRAQTNSNERTMTKIKLHSEANSHIVESPSDHNAIDTRPNGETKSPTKHPADIQLQPLNEALPPTDTPQDHHPIPKDKNSHPSPPQRPKDKIATGSIKALLFRVSTKHGDHPCSRSELAARRQLHVTRMISLIAVSTFVLYIIPSLVPLSVLFFDIGRGAPDSAIHHWVPLCWNLMATHSILNLFIYYFKNVDFRKGITETLTRGRGFKECCCWCLNRGEKTGPVNKSKLRPRSTGNPDSGVSRGRRSNSQPKD